VYEDWTDGQRERAITRMMAVLEMARDRYGIPIPDDIAQWYDHPRVQEPADQTAT
jgi:hypothetical protein